MAAAPTSIYMKSSDLIKKEPLDYGGFGQVYLCYHKTYGQVVLKTVYTGPPRNEGNKKSLIEEGLLMQKLNHQRVVKLLGLILEDGAYSLVMELIPKGNLLAMLNSVDVPMSIKGRIILEILEGMVYLSNSNVIHKDLKPENILVDEEFHIKIADLGLATCQSWSRLTKEESRRQSRMGCRSYANTAGTLCYMAPEHLDSIHARSTEKSDVYSFAIVVWVILTGREPYENAFNEDHICQCVRKGDRPNESIIPACTPPEMMTLMKKCWHQDPNQRPTFAESYESFQLFYKDNLEKDVERDACDLMAKYKGPTDFVEKMQSLSMERLTSQTDSPTSLRADVSPVEASIEDMNSLTSSELSIQGDAAPVCNNLEVKLAQELDYHKHGSYSCVDHSAAEVERETWREMLRRAAAPQQVSSVQSWTKSDPVAGSSLENFNWSGQLPSVPSLSPSVGVPPMTSYSQYQYSQYEQAQPWPVPIPESEAPDPAAGMRYNSAAMLPHSDQGSLFIQNASGIQIGHNNQLSIRSQDYSLAGTHATESSTMFKELLQKYEDHSVTEEHLDLLRENIGVKWKRCARRLGLSEVEVETIEHDYARDGLKEMVYQALEKWKMKEGYVGCTVGKLCRALSDSVKVDLLCRLLEICRSPTSPIS
ncbi:receptor-interacting serine/threonine-protein kinase 1 [Scleropages formosus]|uniref:Receptor (TNFRSF)-interacting serine-threonine kinase 1, like n=1 Tax=Scleropages formosus TaxID=113540 RepID=A0A8C9RG88_SCLFO|nr:receptor-interacting serine/threonine-protein kinase 1-like [Scleropages formosus]XP_029109140.1 receptor-interacting serine/threonine-protein kinase 1-like [Scleropages formosus]